MSAAPLRVWQLQDYSIDHIRRMISLASQAGVNRIQLSHKIVMKAEDILHSAKLAADINSICELARTRNIAIDIWTHELTGVPDELLADGKANLDSPRLWEFVRAKYNKLFYLCPAISGLVLTMHETSIKIFQDSSVKTSMTPEKRVTRLVDEMAGVCRSFGKDLFVRTFSYEPHELTRILDGLKACKSDFVVMTKCVPHDWQPYYPYNPAIGNVGGKRQVVEFDLGHEFTGLSRIPYIMIDYFKRHWDYDLGKGAFGAVLRIERYGWRSVDTPNQAVVDVCTKLLGDSSADPHELYRQWLSKRYGDKAVEPLFSALMRTQKIVDLGYFVLGYWVTNHSLLPSYEYATKSLSGRTSAKWDPSTKPIEQELLDPTWDTVRKIGEEKDQALALVEQSLVDIETAKPYVKPTDYQELRDYFERARSMVIVWKAAMECIFGITICRKSEAESNRSRLRAAADRLEQEAHKHKQQLIEMSADSYSSRGHNVGSAAALVELARSTARKA